MRFMSRQYLRSLLTVLAIMGFVPLTYAANGYLDILSKPAGVDIYINNQRVGRTPITGLEVQSGEVNIRAVKEGYGTATDKIVLKPGEAKKVTINLKASKEETGSTQNTVTIAQDKGHLTVVNKLGDVPVIIDGISKGNASVQIEGLATGKHELEVGRFKKIIQIYKDYRLVVRVDHNGIVVTNDLETKRQEDARKQAELEKEQARKREEQKIIAEVENEKAKNKKIREDEVEVFGGVYEYNHHPKQSAQITRKNSVTYTSIVNKYERSTSKQIYDLNFTAERNICKYEGMAKIQCNRLSVVVEIYDANDYGIFVRNGSGQLNLYVYLDGKLLSKRQDIINDPATRYMEIRDSLTHDGYKFKIVCKVERGLYGGVDFFYVQREDSFLPRY